MKRVAPHRRRPRRRPPDHRGPPRGPRAVRLFPHPRAARPASWPRSPTSRHRRMTRMTVASAITDDNRRWWTLGAMCFALFMIMLDNTVVNVALPSIQKDLRRSISGLEWTVNAYTLVVRRPARHRRAPRRHLRPPPHVPLRRRVFGAVERLHRLLAERGLARRRPRRPGHRRRVHDARDPLDHLQRVPARRSAASAIGTWAGVSAMALAIGPVVGGFLVENVSWQSIFFLNVPVAAVAVVRDARSPRTSRATRPSSHQVDIPGVAAITVGARRARARARRGQRVGLGLAAIIGLFAVVVVGARRVRARRARSRASRWSTSRFFRSRSFLGANIVAFIVSASRCSRCSSSSRCTCRTSRATRRCRRACASCPRPR